MNGGRTVVAVAHNKTEATESIHLNQMIHPPGCQVQSGRKTTDDKGETTQTIDINQTIHPPGCQIQSDREIRSSSNMIGDIIDGGGAKTGVMVDIRAVRREVPDVGDVVDAEADGREVD